MAVENRSVWFEAAPDKRRFAVLKGNVEADVVVIGAGIAGMSAAWHLAQRGKKVVVLEKNHVATGDTGYTTGFMTKVPDASMQALAARYGTDFVRRLLQASTEAQKQFFALIEGEKIDCSFSRCSSLWGSYQEKDEALAAEFAALHDAVDAVSMEKKPNGSVFAEAMRIPDEGKYNARQFLLALPGKAKGAIRVFEESEALDVAFTRFDVEVKTEGGTVKAGKVILTTGRPLPAFKELQPLIDPKLTYVISATYAGSLPIGIDVQWDTLDPYFYYRAVSESEIIVGGCDMPASEGGKGEPFARLRAFVAERLQGKHEVLNEWSGSIFHTEDGLPYVFEHPHVKDRAYAAVGFGGNGMVFGFMAGRVLAALASGDEDEAAGLLSLDRTGAKVAAHEVKAKAVAAGFVPFCSEDEFIARSIVMKPVDDRQIVVFKVGGKYYALDNACTHQGGSLCDGTLEDGVIQCPLHGAKFEVATGDVKGPPATRAVKKHETRVVNGEVQVKLGDAAEEVAPTESEAEKREHSWKALFFFLLVPLGLFAAEFAYQYYVLLPGILITSLARSLALTGATLIGCALFSSALFKWFPALSTHWRTRRRLGVSGVCFIALHILTVTKFYFSFDPSVIWFSLNPLKNPVVFGTIAIPILLAMALTSTDWAYNLIGPARWKNLHRFVYVAYWAAIFHFLTIDPTLKDHLPGAILIAITAAAVFGQLFWWVKIAGKKRFLTLGGLVGAAIILLYLITAYLVIAK
jgi:glycine/D-amino acid oxidase-like deaminating enzyme/nitrite reductase/ring-hydroxylating ferredoxin subunit/DMSO/TMAO reductase YedYZ heme-binding membrane subunit